MSNEMISLSGLYEQLHEIDVEIRTVYGGIASEKMLEEKKELEKGIAEIEKNLELSSKNILKLCTLERNQVMKESIVMVTKFNVVLDNIIIQGLVKNCNVYTTNRNGGYVEFNKRLYLIFNALIGDMSNELGKVEGKFVVVYIKNPKGEEKGELSYGIETSTSD